MPSTVDPMIAVVIPLYNAAAYIAETLDSLFGETNRLGLGH